MIKAVLVALWHGKGTRWKRFVDFLLLMRATLTEGKVDDETYQRRLAFCRACPVFWRDLQTCGSPLSEYPDLGCWCWMPAKARLKAASCWMRQHANDQPWGWPDGL